MWEKSRGESKKNAPLCSEDVDAKLVRLLESQSLTTTVQREYTAEERKIKDAILAQYSQMTDDEDENDDEAAGDTSENGLERNKNAFVVQQAEKLKREQAKLASQQKKDKDKEDRYVNNRRVETDRVLLSQSIGHKMNNIMSSLFR